MKIGICGTGTIASWVSDILNQLNNENIILYACATSPGFDCTEFAQKYHWQKILPSFEALMQDPEVNLVYIAMPNNFHYDLCMQAIKHGKNVVCEKPFAVHAEQCRQVLQAAEQKGVFLSEALWPCFLPAHCAAKKLLQSGAIGTVQEMNITMLDFVLFLERVKHLETGGGVLLDEGPYALGCMTMYMGTEIAQVESRTRKLDTGVDVEDELRILFKDGRKASLHLRMDTPHEEHRQEVEIIGTTGKLWMNEVANPTRVQLMTLENEIVQEIKVPEQLHFRGMPPVSGYEHEWIAFEKALAAGKRECEEVPHNMTQAISQVMDSVFSQAEIVFPF